MKLCPVFLSLHCKDHLKSHYNFFGRIFVTLYFVEIFNLIGFANNTTCDITLHNDFLISFVCLKAVKLLHINEET